MQSSHVQSINLIHEQVDVWAIEELGSRTTFITWGKVLTNTKSFPKGLVAVETF